MNDFIKQQQELAIDWFTDEDDGALRMDKWDSTQLEDLITKTITNTGEELMRLAEGERTKDTDGKTYHAEHPDVIKDKTIDTLKKHITNVTGVRI